jgi:hypothetical protein
MLTPAVQVLSLGPKPSLKTGVREYVKMLV